MPTSSSLPNNKSKPDLDNETQSISACILLFLGLMVINSITLNYFKKLRARYHFCYNYIQDVAITTTIGILAGLMLSLINYQNVLETIKTGYQDLFMIVLLPPIIFNSAINMHKKSFFSQLGSIIIFAIFGTAIATLLTTTGIWIFGKLGIFSKSFDFIESAAFGSLISSTDPVSVLAIFGEIKADKILYALIFGESILNDAVTIVMYKIVGQVATSSTSLEIWHLIADFLMLFIGSVLLGYIVGIVSAWVLKVNFSNVEYSIRQENTETSIMLLVPWVSYLLGESFELSGIVCIMFCGISMAKYALPNLSQPGKKLTKKLYSTLGSSFENLVFLFIGMGFFSFPNNFQQIGASMIITSIIIITLSRYLQIKMLTTLINQFRTKTKITQDFEFVMFYSGFRGAMAFALSVNAAHLYNRDQSGSVMLTLTLIYVTFTIYFFGAFLVPILQKFNVQEKYINIDRNYEPSTVNFLNKIKAFFGVADFHLSKILIKEGEDINEGNDSNYNMHKDNSRLLELRSKQAQLNIDVNNDISKNLDKKLEGSPLGLATYKLTDFHIADEVRNPLE